MAWAQFNTLMAAALSLVLLAACDASSSAKGFGDKTTTSDSDNIALQVAELNVAELNYTAISASEFVGEYFDLANIVSSTQFWISDPLQFTVPASVISFSLSFHSALAGDDLFLVNLINPNGDSVALQRVSACFSDFCALVMPNRPEAEFAAIAGDWSYQIVVEQNAISRADLRNIRVNMLARVGSAPDLSDPLPVVIPVQAYVTSSVMSSHAINSAMNQLVNLFKSNNIVIDFKPVIYLHDSELESVSPDYTDVRTRQLLARGAADVANIYFVKDFATGAGQGGSLAEHPRMPGETASLLGIAPGIPGTLGVQGNGNGVLVALGETQSGDSGSRYVTRSSSELAAVTAHELGHFLGLYHTTEIDASAQDVLADTPVCTLGDDETRIDPATCPDGQNLMFPLLHEDGGTVLSPGQRFVLSLSPLAQ